MTFGDLDLKSSVLADWLAGKGVGPGDHIADMMRSSPVALALLFAIGKADAVWVPLNVAARGDSLAHILEHASPRFIIADGEAIATIEATGARMRVGQLLSSADVEAVRTGAKSISPQTAMVDPDHPCTIIYASGTTGQPKGGVVSQRMPRLSGEAVAMVSAAAADGDVIFMWEPL